jgi:hypothetical protein
MTVGHHGGPRKSQRTVARTPGTGNADAIGSLETELEQERASRLAIEKQLGELMTVIASLRTEVRALTGARPGGKSSPPPARHRPASRMVEIPRDVETSGPAYWLRRCEGFRVVIGSHSLGTVEEIRFGRHHDRPDALTVLTESRRHQLLLVAVEDIAEISNEEQLIVLATDPRDPESHRRVALARSLARIFRRECPAG